MNKHSLYWQDLSRNGFFYYTALLFCYCAMFACEVFFVPYYMEVGFSNAQIGVIMALRSAAATVFPPFIGAFADKIRSKRRALTLCLLLVSLFIFLTPTVSGVYWLSLLIGALYNGFSSPVSSLAETWALTETERARSSGSRVRYGPIRAAASLGYALFCLFYSLLLQKTGGSNAIALYASVALGLISVGIAAGGRKWEHSAAAESPHPALTFRELKPGRLLHNYYYMTFLLIYAMMSCALNFAQNYISQLIVAAGGGASLSGTFNFLRAFLEIPMFFWAPRLERRFGYKKLLLASCLAFFLANMLYICFDSIPAILIGQGIAGMAGGLMFACALSYIFTLVPHSLSATAQTLSAGCNNIICMLANLAGGFLIDAFGIRSIYAVCAGILLLAFLLFWATLGIGRLRGIAPYTPESDPVEQALRQKAEHEI